MLANYHTHTTFCDGKNTPEEIVLYAIEKGIGSLGFSGHGNTPFDQRYCMKDTVGYIKEISRLKEKYGEKIQIYCGVEEDAFSYVKRSDFDYIIGSCHYLKVGEKYYPVDSSHDYLKRAVEAFDYDTVKLAESYYSAFVSYIAERKPDVVGHFDLITKFDEIGEPLFLSSPEYKAIAEKYMQTASDNDVIFEVNTGAIARGLRTAPYPAENLLYILKKKDCKLILSSDSHEVATFDFYFAETEKLLRGIGFEYVYEIDGGAFRKRML